MCDRPFSVSVVGKKSHDFSVLQATADVSRNCPFGFFWNAPGNRHVCALACFVKELVSKKTFCLFVFCHHKQSRRVFVYSMYQTGTWVVCLELYVPFEVPCNGVHHCSRVVAASRMYHHSRFFVDDHQLVVFVHNVERNIFGNNLQLLFWCFELYGNHIVRLYFVVCLDRIPIGKQVTAVGSFLNFRSGDAFYPVVQEFVDA